MAQSLTSEAIQAIVASVEQGSSLRQAALASGFTDDQVDEWRRIARGEPSQRNGFQYSESLKSAATALTDQVQRAIAKRYTVLVNGLYANATTPNPKTGWIDTQAADKLLSKAPETRQDWYEHRVSQQSGTVQHHHAHTIVKELSDDELRALSDGSENV